MLVDHQISTSSSVSHLHVFQQGQRILDPLRNTLFIVRKWLQLPHQRPKSTQLKLRQVSPFTQRLWDGRVQGGLWKIQGGRARVATVLWVHREDSFEELAPAAVRRARDSVLGRVLILDLSLARVLVHILTMWVRGGASCVDLGLRVWGEQHQGRAATFKTSISKNVFFPSINPFHHFSNQLLLEVPWLSQVKAALYLNIFNS